MHKDQKNSTAREAAGKPVLVLKIGGRVTESKNSLIELAKESADLMGAYRLVLVHGGGAEVSKITKKFGLEPVFKDGIRMTSPEEMEIVDMVLAGRMNKLLVRLLNRFSSAVGISGSDGHFFTGACFDPEESGETHTGQVTCVDTRLLEVLLEAEYLPVVNSTSMDSTGKPLNINADEVALAVASKMKAADLVFLSDIPGILVDEKPVSLLNEKEIDTLIEKETINGGMVPKVRSSLEALRQGVGSIVIGQYIEGGDLKALLEGRGGTKIVPYRKA
jgi:acetylglutamate kinase